MARADIVYFLRENVSPSLYNISPYPGVGTSQKANENLTVLKSHDGDGGGGTHCVRFAWDSEVRGYRTSVLLSLFKFQTFDCSIGHSLRSCYLRRFCCLVRRTEALLLGWPLHSLLHLSALEIIKWFLSHHLGLWKFLYIDNSKKNTFHPSCEIKRKAFKFSHSKPYFKSIFSSYVVISNHWMFKLFKTKGVETGRVTW